MEKNLKILLLEDSRTDAEIIQRLLHKELTAVEFRLASNKKGFLQALDEFTADVILSDNSLPGFDASEALKIVRQQMPHIPFILVTGTVSEEFAASIIKQGADDYILKDRLIRLSVAINTALQKRKDESERKIVQEQLKEREEQLELFIRHSPASLAMFDCNMNYIAVSSRWALDYGLNENDLISRNHYEVFPEIPQRWKDIHARCLKGAIEKNEEDLLTRGDGKEIWLRWETRPWKRASGEIGGIIIFTEDITDRKKAAEELLETHKRLKQAQQIAHLGNWEVNFATNHAKWSDEAYRIFGVKPGDHNMSTEEWLNYVHPDDRERIMQEIEKGRSRLEGFSLDHRIVRKDGTIRHVHSESKYEFDADGKVIGQYGITHDITDRKLAEEELKKSNERFQFAAKATLDIIWELNFETKEFLVHEGGGKLFGDQRDLGWNIGVEGAYVHEQDREQIREDFTRARMDPTCELWENEYRMISTDESVVHVINHAIFIRDEQGKAIRAIGAITDISDKKKLQEELLEKEIHEQMRITAITLETQEKERAAIGQELHDNVNQILVGTSLILSTAKGHPANSDAIISACLDNLKNAIHENRKIAHELVGPDLASDTLVHQVSELCNIMFQPLDINTVINAQHFQEPKLTHAQKLAVYRIAQEQCTNIVKYAAAKTVTITLVTDSSNFYMSITDNGKGMETGKKVSGIGIRNITGRLVIFNGTVNIITAPGEGFTLEISMPCGQ